MPKTYVLKEVERDVKKILKVRKELNCEAERKTKSTLTARLLSQLDGRSVSSIPKRLKDLLPKLDYQCQVIASKSIVCGLLDLHASNIQRKLSSWKHNHHIWHKRLEIAKADYEESASDLLELSISMSKWQTYFNRVFACLPLELNTNSNHRNWFENTVVDCFQEWYEKWDFQKSSTTILASPLFIVQQHIEQLNDIVLRIPNRAFNDRFPKMMLTANNLPEITKDLPNCDLCYQPTLVHRPCPTCKEKSLVCYSCIRKQVWAAHHDNERVYNAPRPVHCAFCRTPINLETLHNDFQNVSSIIF